MSFRFKRHESVRDGFHRIVAAELEAVKSLLQSAASGSQAQSEESVHDARRRLKMVRALLRLFRKPLGKDFCRNQVHALGEVAYGLAPARDARVRLAALDAIADGAGPECEALIAKLRQSCEVQLRRAKRSSLDHQAMGELDDLIKATTVALVGVPLAQKNWDLLKDGIERTCRRVRKAHAAAVKEPNTLALHHWRKRTKDMQYQIRLLQGACPKELKRLDHRLDRLNDTLGDDHDLALLEVWLGKKGPSFRRTKAAQHLLKTVARCRDQLQRRAFRHADKWLPESPHHFTRHLAGGWKAWHRA